MKSVTSSCRKKSSSVGNANCRPAIGAGEIGFDFSGSICMHTYKGVRLWLPGRRITNIVVPLCSLRRETASSLYQSDRWLEDGSVSGWLLVFIYGLWEVMSKCVLYRLKVIHHSSLS